MNRNKAFALAQKCKGGNSDPKIIELMRQIKADEMRLEQTKSRTSEQAFSTRNDEESVNSQIDLHGQTKIFALKVTRDRLQMTKEDLEAGRLAPNVGNGRDHIFKIICGAGKHSQGKAVLKPAIAGWLEAQRYEHYADMQNGVFLVRLWKY